MRLVRNGYEEGPFRREDTFNPEGKGWERTATGWTYTVPRRKVWWYKFKALPIQTRYRFRKHVLRRKDPPVAIG